MNKQTKIVTLKLIKVRQSKQKKNGKKSNQSIIN